MANETITYEKRVQGFPSFYSYRPDMMVGMNNHFYSFKGGELFRHNVNEARNEFYGVDYPTIMKSVFNDTPLQNKLYKTVNIEGDAPWAITFNTDTDQLGEVQELWFEKKEQTWYAFIRFQVKGLPTEWTYDLRSLNGIGKSTTAVINAAETTIDFDLSVSIGSVISVGDLFYYAVPPFDTPVFAGVVTEINIDLPAGINNIVIDNSSGTPIVNQDDFYLYIKSAVAESHGVLGHYCVFTMQNEADTKIELFALETEVMKSYP